MTAQDDILTEDTLTPVDRYPGSPTFGIEVLNFIALWDEPGRKLYKSEHMTGALHPYTLVKLHEYNVVGSALWAKVSARQGGRLQKGWCNAMVLEEVGRRYLAALQV